MYALDDYRIMTDEKDSVSTIEASKKSFSIIESLAENETAGVTELATDVGLPKSTVYKHLVTLQQMGYVDSERAEYYLTDKLGRVTQGLDAQAQSDRVKNEIKDLADLSGEVSGIYIERDGRGETLYQAKGDETLSDFQITSALHASAPGKVIMAHLPKARIDRILERHGQPQFTENTLTQRDVLETELTRIRDRDIAFDREEQQVGVRGIGVPLEPSAHEWVGSIYVYGPADRMTGKIFEERLPGLLLKSRKSIKNSFGSVDLGALSNNLNNDQ
jgi:DNA-binding IclR family transcriptional regulator